jgi:hypothetical protein
MARLNRVGAELLRQPLVCARSEKPATVNNSKTWSFRFYDDQGRRRTISLKTDDEAEAINRARELLY